MDHQPAVGRRAGFTLVELLLTVVLLSLLIGAMVFNFNQLQIGASLDEGVLRIKTLLRLAEAEAAHSGRRIQLQFLPDENLESLSPLYSIDLLWEPDPLQKPGEFQQLNRGSWNLSSVNDVVGVSQVLTRNMTVSSSGASNPDQMDDAIETSSISYPPLTFYPDGSSDSVRLILASRNEDDDRRLQLTWQGLTGTVSIEPLRTLSYSDLITNEQPNDASSLWKDPTGRETESSLDNVY